MTAQMTLKDRMLKDDDPLKIHPKKDPLADYRDKSVKDMCAGCEFSRTFKGHKALQDQTICRNCIVTGLRTGDAVPDIEADY